VTVLPDADDGRHGAGQPTGHDALANCETLGVLCLVQAAEPGTPFIYAPIALTMDRAAVATPAARHTQLSVWPAQRWRATTVCR